MPSDIILPRAILFDMDGTLTEPMLDFPRIKAEMGIGDRPILESMAAMSLADRRAAQMVLDRHEEAAAINSMLNPGCKELLNWLDANHVKTALITRNSRRSMQTVLDRHDLRIEVLITRDDAEPKPDPAPLLLACRRLSTHCENTWMVGDGRYDIEAGTAAEMRTVWISHRRERHFPTEPWRQVVDLPELLAMLVVAG